MNCGCHVPDGRLWMAAALSLTLGCAQRPENSILANNLDKASDSWDAFEINVPGGGVDVAAFSADGRLLVVGGNWGAFVYDIQKQNQLFHIEAHGNFLWRARAKWAAPVAVFSVFDPVHAYWFLCQMRYPSVTCAAFSPDMMLVATGGFDSRVRVWSAERGRAVATLEEFPLEDDRVDIVNFSSDGTRLVGASKTGIIVWEIPSYRRVFRRDSRVEWVKYVAFLPGSHDLVAHASVSGIYILDGDTGQQLRYISTQGAIHHLRISPDGRRAFYLENDSLVTMDLETGQELSRCDAMVLPPAPRMATYTKSWADWLPDRNLAIGSRFHGQESLAYVMIDLDECWIVKGFPQRVGDVVISPDGSYAALLEHGGPVTIRALMPILDSLD